MYVIRKRIYAFSNIALNWFNQFQLALLGNLFLKQSLLEIRMTRELNRYGETDMLVHLISLFSSKLKRLIELFPWFPSCKDLLLLCKAMFEYFLTYKIKSFLLFISLHTLQKLICHWLTKSYKHWNKESKRNNQISFTDFLKQLGANTLCGGL